MPCWARFAHSSPRLAKDAAPLADDLAARVRGDIDVLAALARVRLAEGNAVGALDSVESARPSLRRPDLFHLHSPGIRTSRRPCGALAAFNAALQLDPRWSGLV